MSTPENRKPLSPRARVSADIIDRLDVSVYNMGLMIPLVEEQPVAPQAAPVAELGAAAVNSTDGTMLDRDDRPNPDTMGMWAEFLLGAKEKIDA